MKRFQQTKHWKWTLGITIGILFVAAIILANTLIRTPLDATIDESKIDKVNATRIANTKLSELCTLKVKDTELCTNVSYSNGGATWLYYDHAYGVVGQYTKDEGDYTFTVYVSESGKVVDASVSKSGTVL